MLNSKGNTMDSRAQVSFEYLILIFFAVLLVVIATVLALNLTTIADLAKLKVLEYRDKTISSLMS